MGARTRHPSATIAAAVSAALRALPIGIPGALLGVPAALAQTLEPAPLSADIPQQPLAEALAAFARQTGVQLIYESEVARNQKSGPAPAGMSANDALLHILQDTGLRFEYLTPRSVRILARKPAAPPKNPAALAGSGQHEALEQVIVTANRREESLQDVPITIQMLSGERLGQLNIKTFDDLVTNLPGVTAHGIGPGQNSINIRGVATGQHSVQGAGVVGPYPNVALYLDEQSAQLPVRNLDIYAADLERIEVLEGPQGTLFGAGAEAGVVRYITNKPRLDVTEAAANAGYATTAHGDPGSSLDATLNVPIIPNALAVRAVIYNESRGGYINNVPATFTRENSDLGIHYAAYPANAAGQCPNGKPPGSGVFPGYCVPPGSPVISNDNLAANDINPVTYQGIRAEALYRFNDDWTALLAQSYQNVEADGVFAEQAANSLDQPQPDLTVQLFNPAFVKDRFENTALTVEGRLAAVRLLYSGAYLVRNVEQVLDYTNYARGFYVDYYQCANPHPSNPATARCFTPSSTWHDQERNTHQTQELRLITPVNWRLRSTGGLFYEKYDIQEQVDWLYLTALPYFHAIGPPTGYYTLDGSPVQANGAQVTYFTPGAVFVPGRPPTSINPSIRPLGDGFFDDITRGYTQKAAYTSIDFDLIPKVLTLTGGTRYSRTYTWEVGSDVTSFGCQILAAPVPNPCVNHSSFTNLDALGLRQTYSTFTSRANLSWKVTPDTLVYYTWSQGFRAGGYNRGLLSGAISPLNPGPHPWQAEARLHGGWFPSLAFSPDTLTSNELGWKTTWGSQRIQWNGALYQEYWDDVQLTAFNGGEFGPGESVTNAGNYRIRGVETSTVARVMKGLTVELGVNWNQTELVKQETFQWADGTPINFSDLQTGSGLKLANPSGTLGGPLAGAPPFQGNIRTRYEFALDQYDAFMQFGAVHQAHSLATTDQLTVDAQGNSTFYDLPAFTTYDAAIGIGRDAWVAQLYGENLTDTRAELWANFQQWYKAVTVSRPRTIGLRFSYRYGGS
jgi:outer membrane receptor protein involved in Fe transport